MNDYDRFTLVITPEDREKIKMIAEYCQRSIPGAMPGDARPSLSNAVRFAIRKVADEIEQQTVPENSVA